MTATARHDTVSVTDGADVRVRVNGAGSGSVVPIRPDLAQESAYTRAIPRNGQPSKTNKPGKVRNFAQQHAAEVKEAPELAWLTRQLPETLEQVATTVIPRGVRNPAVWVGLFAARLFKLAAHLLGYLACFATATDKRAAVALILTVLTIAGTLTATALAG